MRKGDKVKHPKCGKNILSRRVPFMVINGLAIRDGVLTRCGDDIRGELIIPDGVTGIGSYAFEECTSLTSIINHP